MNTDDYAAEASRSATSTYNRADKGKRALAYLIDALISGIASAVFSIFSGPVGAVVGAAYWLLRDGLDFQYMHHRSFGKHFMNIRAVRLDGAPMDLETSIRRNWPLALAGLAAGTPSFLHIGWILSLAGLALVLYEAYRVLDRADSRRWGDELAGTVVVDES